MKYVSHSFTSLDAHSVAEDTVQKETKTSKAFKAALKHLKLGIRLLMLDETANVMAKLSLLLVTSELSLC